MDNIENFPSNAVAKEFMEWVTGNEFYDNSYVGKWLFQVIGLEMAEVRRIFDQLQVQIFPEIATWGLVYHEQKHGLTLDAGISLEKRRSYILAKRNYKTPMNPRQLGQILESLVARTVEIQENAAPYTFLVKVIITDDGMLDEEALKNRIDNMKPSHLSYTIVTERPLSAAIYIGATMQQATIMNFRQVI